MFSFIAFACKDCRMPDERTLSFLSSYCMVGENPFLTLLSIWCEEFLLIYSQFLSYGLGGPGCCPRNLSANFSPGTYCLFLFGTLKSIIVEDTRDYNCNNIPIRYDEVTKLIYM